VIPATAVVGTPRTLRRRLPPLQVAVGLSGLTLWIPVEKLFMTQIGFTPASIGVMAAAYAAVVPSLEIPSGILADRWSRSRIMALACVALAASSALGGLSRNVPTYVVAAMFLGVYFALNSGTVDSVVYDTVLEETGSSELYQRWIGRVRVVESAALVVSALAGGVLAGWTSARLTYFVSVPLVAVGLLGFLRFREPRLHRAAGPEPLRRHVAVTFTTMVRQPQVRQVMLLAALAAMISQALFEFGPLWLVALAAPAVLFGPYWAGLMSTLGVGGAIAGRLNLARPAVLVVFAVVTPAATVAMALLPTLTAAIIGQIVLALLLAVIGIHTSQLLHDAVPAKIRTGVSSGVGTLSWLVFLPFSLVFGWLGRDYGVQRAGWLLVAATTAVAVLLLVSTRRGARAAAAPVPETTAAAGEIACRELVDRVTGYLDVALPGDRMAIIDAHLTECDGCTEYLEQIRATIGALGRIGGPDPSPPPAEARDDAVP
jgi:MFS family permease